MRARPSGSTFHVQLTKRNDDCDADTLPTLSLFTCAVAALIHIRNAYLHWRRPTACPLLPFFTFSFFSTARSVATTILSRSHTNSHWAYNCCALALAYTRWFWLRWSLLLLSYGKRKRRRLLYFIRCWRPRNEPLSFEVGFALSWRRLAVVVVCCCFCCLPFGSSAVPAVSLFLRLTLSPLPIYIHTDICVKGKGCWLSHSRRRRTVYKLIYLMLYMDDVQAACVCERVCIWYVAWVTLQLECV